MTDVFGTLGPSCENTEILANMFKEGMTGIRINLSHVMLEDCRESIERIKEAAEVSNIKPKILIDMQGPELRIGKLDEILEIREGDILWLVGDKFEIISHENSENKDSSNLAPEVNSDDVNSCCLSEMINEGSIVPVDSKLLHHLRPGQEILLDDGKISAEVKNIERNMASLTVKRGGRLSSRKSIAIVGETVDMPALTAIDKENLKLAHEYGVTGVMQPFVRSADDLIQLRKVLDDFGGSDIKIYAKIENMAGVNNIESFLTYADEIIIARGDLGNAMPLWELPKVQKKISKICNSHNIPFMVVTQMLSSMEHSKVPTRAEVSDIYNAILDGASSVMVTGETAIGDNPVDVIKYLSLTAKSAYIG